MVYKIYKTDVYVPRCLRCRGFFIVNATVAVLYHAVCDGDAVTSCAVCDTDAVTYGSAGFFNDIVVNALYL